MKYYEKLLAIAKYSNSTQTELAQKLGVSFPTLNSWIHAKSIPRQKALEKIDHWYLELVGNLTIDNSVINEQEMRLSVLQKNTPNPFQMIMSRKDIYEELLLAMTYHSNGIEGSTFNEPEVKAVLFDDVTIPNKTVREHQEAKNHQAALGFVMRWIRDEQGTITQEFVQKIHQILMNGILHNAGHYRTHAVRIAGSFVATTNPATIPDAMQKFITEITTSFDCTVPHIAKSHALFEQIHPFSDGNGRVGRLIMLTQALKSNMAPIVIRKEKKMAYYKYLQESQLHENHVPLTSFVYDGIFEGYQLLQE